MYRDQIRHNLQRIMETTKGHWGEPLEGAEPPCDQGDTRPRVDLSMKMLSAHKAQGLELHEGSTAQWQRAS